MLLHWVTPLEQGILKLSALTYGGPGAIILGISHSLSTTLHLKI
jgi:hypothetical protein